MGPQIETGLLDESSDEPTFLRATSGGFQDEENNLHSELAVQLIEAKSYVKLFIDNEIVHTSEVCKSDPNCTQCNDQRARRYIRLLLEFEGQQYFFDVPPTAKQRFVELARKGIDGPLRLTCTPAERNGRTWGDIGFEIPGSGGVIDKNYMVEGASEQLFITRYPSGEVGHYAWSHQNDYDTMVLITEDAFRRAWHFIRADPEAGASLVLNGVIASEENPEESECLPMGTRIQLVISRPPGRCFLLDIRPAA